MVHNSTHPSWNKFKFCYLWKRGKIIVASPKCFPVQHTKMRLLALARMCFIFPYNSILREYKEYSVFFIHTLSFKTVRGIFLVLGYNFYKDGARRNSNQSAASLKALS